MSLAAALIPASSSYPAGSREKRSNQDGIRYPELRANGIMAAVGQMVLRWLDLIAARLDDKLGSSVYTLKIGTNSGNILVRFGTKHKKSYLG